MLSAALPLLACPLCSRPLQRTQPDVGPLRCGEGHTYDVARHGYVNVLTGSGAHGLVADTADMVAARERVQSAHLYDPVADALADVATSANLPAGGLVDLGGGTGYYAAALLDAMPDRVGLTCDLSRYAARRAAKAHPRLGAVVANVWERLPVCSGAAALLTCVFAPRNPTESARVLAKGGLVVVVTPRPDHLAQLASSAAMLAVDEHKEQRLAAQFVGFELDHERVVTSTLVVDRDRAADIVLMGPNAHHRSADDVRADLARGSERREVTLDVRISVFRRP